MSTRNQLWMPDGVPPICSRREWLQRSGFGMGALGLTALFTDDANRAQAGIAESPMAQRPPQFPGRARHVIHIFCNGGPSHVDTFDPKPALMKYAGQALPIDNLPTERKTGAAFPSPFPFRRYGESGIEVSDLFSHVGERIDDIAVVRSLHANVPNHEPSLMLMNCGDGQMVRPSVGSWVTYGLGTENQNLPGFIAMCPGGLPITETANWRAGFLPGAYQGTYINTEHQDIEKLIAHIHNSRLALMNSADNWIWCSHSTHIIGSSGVRTRRWRVEFNRMNWRTVCSRRRPRPSMCPRSRGTFMSCMARGSMRDS